MVTSPKFLKIILAAEFQIKSELSKSEATSSSVIFTKVIFITMIILCMRAYNFMHSFFDAWKYFSTIHLYAYRFLYLHICIYKVSLFYIYEIFMSYLCYCINEKDILDIEERFVNVIVKL